MCFERGILAALAVPIWPAKNPSPPRHLPALTHTPSAAIVLTHTLAGRPVLVAKMVVLRVVPTGAQFGFARSLLFLGAPDTLLDGTRGLVAIVAGRTASLGVGGQCGREKGEGEE